MNLSKLFLHFVQEATMNSSWERESCDLSDEQLQPRVLLQPFRGRIFL